VSGVQRRVSECVDVFVSKNRVGDESWGSALERLLDDKMKEFSGWKILERVK